MPRGGLRWFVDTSVNLPTLPKGPLKGSRSHIEQEIDGEQVKLIGAHIADTVVMIDGWGSVRCVVGGPCFSSVLPPSALRFSRGSTRRLYLSGCISASHLANTLDETRRRK